MLHTPGVPSSSCLTAAPFLVASFFCWRQQSWKHSEIQQIPGWESVSAQPGCVDSTTKENSQKSWLPPVLRKMCCYWRKAIPIKTLSFEPLFVNPLGSRWTGLTGRGTLSEAVCGDVFPSQSCFKSSTTSSVFVFPSGDLTATWENGASFFVNHYMEVGNRIRSWGKLPWVSE